MAYVINLTDGTTFATIADGTINTSSSMTLVGKNYAGYGEFLDENFIHLLENSSNTTAPAAPLTGQVWWDKGNNLLKVYNGTTWKTISAASAQSSAPTSNVTGDLWYDTTNQQLKVYTGTGFIVVGPAFSSSEGQTGALPESIEDTGGTPHAVTTIFVNNIRVAIVSKDAAFTPVSAYSTAFPRIYPGITVSKTLSAAYAGNVINNGNLTLGAGGTADVVVVTASGANITGYVSASGNILGSNVTSSGFVTSTGNVTGGNIVTGGLITAVGNITGANLVATNFVGTTVSATGNITGGNLRFGSGVVSGTGNITGGNVISGGLVNTVALTATGNITGGNIITGGGVTATGTITSTGNVVAGTGSFFLGDGGQLSNISAAVSVTRIENGTSNVAVSGSGGNITVGVAGTSNVAVIATTGITATGITVPSITKSGSNAVGNIGSASNYFNQVFATATTALYADVAERFAADEVMEPGTVVELGGEKEITKSRAELSDLVFGVISTKPAFTMNGGAGENDTHPPVAMTGRVPVKVSGTIRKGDRLVSAGDGLARAARPGEATSFNVIGRALESKTSNDVGIVEAIVSIK